MARAPKATPGPGHNSGMPQHDDIRTAVAMEMIFEEKEKKLRDEKKRARLRLVEGKGLLADDTKFLKGLRDKTGSEVIDIFTRQWHLVGAFFPEQHGQMDLFTKKSDAPVRAAYYTMGLVAGLQGKDLEIPPMVAGDDRQQMINGHNEGRAKYKTAWDSVANGDAVVDGTGKGPAGDAAKVGDKAAADFAKDQGEDPLVVNGVKYDNMRQANAARKRLEAQAPAALTGDHGAVKPPWDRFPDDHEAWTEEQRGQFAAWLDAQDPTLAIDVEDFLHAGARGEFKRLRTPAPEGETFLSSEEPVVGDDFKAGGEVKPSAPVGDSGPEGVLPLANDGEGALIPEEVVKPPAAPVRKMVARPDFHAWDEDWEKWTGPQCMEFKRWFESLPPGTIPAITHTGAVDYFNLLREEVQNRADAGPSDDDFEMSEEELAAQAGRPVRQEAETPDPAEVEAAAKKLQESGFAAPAKRSRKRTPA